MGWFLGLFGGKKEKTSEEEKEPSVFEKVGQVLVDFGKVLGGKYAATVEQEREETNAQKKENQAEEELSVSKAVEREVRDIGKVLGGKSASAVDEERKKENQAEEELSVSKTGKKEREETNAIEGAAEGNTVSAPKRGGMGLISRLDLHGENITLENNPYQVLEANREKPDLDILNKKMAERMAQTA